MGLSHLRLHRYEGIETFILVPGGVANAHSLREQMTVGEFGSAERPDRSNAEEASCLGQAERQLRLYAVRAEGLWRPGDPWMLRVRLP